MKTDLMTDPKTVNTGIRKAVLATGTGLVLAGAVFDLFPVAVELPGWVSVGRKVN